MGLKICMQPDAIPERQLKFLILTQYFPPEIGGAPTRLFSIATELKRLGHEVEVVTGMPNYPRGKLFAGYERSFYRLELRDGLTIHRVWLYPATGGGIQRMLNYVSFTFTSLLGILRANRPDFIFVESPPIFLSVPAWLFGMFWRVPFIFNVSDMWPDIIVEGGFLKDGRLVRWMRVLERWSYRKAAYVNAVTEGVRQTLLRRKSVPVGKLLFLPNGADTVRFQPRPPDENLKTKLGLSGKKIILWAGTIGFAHGLEDVLRVAKMLEQVSEIHFLFLGDGSAKSSLVRLRDDLHVRNVTFLDPVPLDQLPPFFSIAEAGLSSLIGIPLYDDARPSKFFPVLASGKPLIFVGKGEAARLVQEARAGVVVTPGDLEALGRAVLAITQDTELARELGQNGRKYVESHLQWSQIVANWIAGLRRDSASSSVTSGSTRTAQSSESAL